MAHALRLAARGLGKVWPNPSVGCVIVRDGQVAGRGWTAPGGRPHAETEALARAGEAARGATAYVSLEPCAHHGRTPPCALKLAEAGISRVVFPLRDPDPRVNGRGAQMLRDAGIEVDEGVLADEARAVNKGFLSRIERGRPMLTLKLATSFDGRIATATGESQWITGPLARRLAHAERARHDAVMVGGGTARADDPQLTVRGMGDIRQPVRVILSRRLDIPEDGHLARTAREVPVWLIHGADADPSRVARWADRGARLFAVGTGETRNLEPFEVLAALGDAGMTRVFCEGGGALAASLLAAGLVDDLIVATAGLALGAEGMPSIGVLGLERLADAPRFTLVDWDRAGGDVVHRWVRAD